MSRRPRGSGSARERGTSAVEFALVLIPLSVLVLGMIQYGWYFYVSQSTAGAASHVTRRLEVGDCWTGDAALRLARSQASQVSALTKTPSDLSTAVVGETQIQVTVTAEADILNFLPMPNGGQVVETVHAQLEDTAEGTPCP